MVIITVKTNTHEHYLAFFFSIISEFRISLPLEGLSTYSCQNIQILKIFFARNGRKTILSILKYSLGMIIFPKAKGICQTVKKPSVLGDIFLGALEGTYYSRLQ